jgi:autotransporter-associated beta strand protein
MTRLIAIAVSGSLLIAGLFWFRYSPTTRPGSTSNFSSVPDRPSLALSRQLSPSSDNPTRNREQLSPASRSNNFDPRKRAWETNFLSKLNDVPKGKPISFELVSGKIASGTLKHVQRSGTEVLAVSGELTDPAPGRFFFQKQTMPGIAGDYVGVVDFPSLGIAYRLEPSGPGGATELVEHPLGDVLCVGLPPRETGRTGKVEEIPPLNPDEFPALPIPGYQQGVIRLQSLTGSKPVIYLDFQGGFTPSWGGITYVRPNFSTEEIREIWRRVAEDYLPFNINVTTDLRVYQAAPSNSRQRVLITPTDTAQPGAGGVSYVGSFDWTTETPCWVFEVSTPRYCAQACAHEAGHGLGLVHDGQQINGVHFEYYYGHNAGNTNTSWSPIMGVAYYDNVTQWSKGEYIDANNLQDQLAIIALQNNVRYRPDDTGDTLATSRYLEAFADFTVGAQGAIERTGDTDAFQFSTSGGLVSLRVDPASLGPNLAVQAQLHDSLGTLLASENPQDTLWASISTNLPAGTYLLTVTGVGRNDPLTNGFSSYASLGFYSITGSVANVRLPTRFAIAENAPTGTLVGVVAPIAPLTDALSYQLTSGNMSNSFAIDNSGKLTVANNAALDYEGLALMSQLTPQFELLVNIIDTTEPWLNETNRRVLVVITNINETPVISGFVTTNSSGLFLGPGWYNQLGTLGGGTVFESFGSFGGDGVVPSFYASVREHAPPGTVVGQVRATDPDFYTLLSYSIVAGDTNRTFAIDADTGTISVAADPVAAIQHLYELTVVVSDQTPPIPLTATSMVSISVELPYQRGGVLCAGYTNIPGMAVSALTNAPGFPLDPAWEDQIPQLEITTSEPGAFGAAARGYLLPPATGQYTFWIAGQDNCELWLSTSTNPAAMTRIASISGDTSWAGPGNWTNYPSQQSGPILLQGGYAYYLEARLKSATTSNYLAVAWECASNAIERQIIPGQFLAPYHLNYLPHPMGLAAYLRLNAIAGAPVGTIRVSDINLEDLETLTIVAADPPGMFSLDPTNGVLRLADGAPLQDTSRTNFTLTVQATDNGLPPLAGSTNIVINVLPADGFANNSIAAEIWTNLPGITVSNLTNFDGFPQRPDVVQPLGSLELTSLETISFGGFAFHTNFSGGLVNSGFLPGNTGLFTFLTNGVTSQTNGVTVINHTGTAPQILPSIGSSSGARIRGYLTPTNTGPFTLFISSADESVLNFSLTTNAAEARPEAWVTGASTNPREWTKYPSQQSVPLWLQSGNRYYFEVLAKTGPGNFASAIFGGDLSPGHLEVGWTGPGLPETNIIAGSFLSTMDLEFPPAFSDRTVALPLTAPNGSVIATLAASDSAADALAYKIISGNISNTFALNASTGEILISDNSSFASYAISNFVLRVLVQDSGYGGLYPLKSAIATITLPVVDNSPMFVWTGQGDDWSWSNPSNWNSTLPNDRSKITFAGVNNRTNHNNYLIGAGLVTLGTTGFYIDGNPLTLSDGLVSRGTSTWAISSTLDSPQSFEAASGILDIAGAINNNGNLLTLDVNSGMIVDGSITGSGGLMKSGVGTLFLNGKPSYTGPTSISSGRLVLTNAEALTASASIDVRAGAIFDVQACSTQYTVPAGHALTGNGTCVGPFTIEGDLAPTSPQAYPLSGPMIPGTAMVFDNLTLAGNTKLTISRITTQNQTIRVTNHLQAGGTLTVVTNRNEIYQVGQSYHLFDAARITRAFDTLDLPLGYRWDTSQLLSNGTVRIAGFLPVGVAILPVRHINGTLVIQFQTAAGHQYDLQSTLSLEPPVHWTPAASRSGTGGMVSILVTTPETLPRRYFRVQSR